MEPDWRRLPGYRDVTPEEWESAVWQRKHTIKNLKEFKAALGHHLPDSLAASIQRDHDERATMSMLIPPQMLNTMNVEQLWEDPVRRYMAPAFDDRRTDWANHPKASRDSLHEAEMWQVEGLTHRYPTKVLAELLSTCPQYCGHCTRMDLVGNDVPQVEKLKFNTPQKDRHQQILEYLRKNPTVRDVVVSGGDIANLPITVLEPFVSALLDIENIRDIRLASKGLMAIPQHFLQDSVLQGLERLAKKAFDRGVDLALHTHVNHAQQVTPLVGKATRKLLEIGFRDVRNQGVLLRGREHDPQGPARSLLHAARSRQDHALLLLHVRHDPQLRALAAGSLRGAAAAARHHGLPPRLRHTAHRVRRAVRRASAGSTSSRPTTGRRASPTGPRTTGPASRWTCPTS